MDRSRAPTPPSSAAPVIARTLSRTTSTGGIILGKYELGRLLGRGSFAKVYQGRALSDSGSDSTTVAVKVIDKSATITASLEPRIISEISAMRRLGHHPNILHLHEVLATKSKIYLVVELAEGGELFAKIARRGRLPEPKARRYFQQLISALHFCHQNGVAHRDIKPQNLLLDKDNNIKISDFGLSALPEHIKNGLLHTSCGTPAYTAPEVLHRKGYDGAKADAWSCGVILFVFLAGALPFDDSNLTAMYKKMHCRDFKFPEGFSKPARSIICRLLDPNPATRMSIEGLMNHSWFKRSLSKEIQPNSAFDWSSVKDNEFKYMSKMNAFDLISMSSGLDLSGLFDGGVCRKKEKKFTSTAKVEEIEEKVEEIGGELGFILQRVKGGRVGLVKGRVTIGVEILEVAKELLLVQFKVVEGAAEFRELQWEELRSGLGGFVLSWYDVS